MSRKFKDKKEKIYIAKRKLSVQHVQHVHDFYEILYLNSGERHFFVNDRTIRAMEGDLVLINPDIIHRAQNTDHVDCEGTLVYFDERFFPTTSIFDTLSSLFEKDYVILRLPVNERTRVEEILSNMLNEEREQGTGYALKLQYSLVDLLVYMTRLMEQHQDLVLEFSIPMHQKVSQIVRHINQNYMEPLTLTSLAEAYYISPPYLSKIFKEAINYSLIEYIHCVRVKEAIKLLKETDMKVLDISETVGFGSITHFGRVFKEVTGNPPKYYKMHQRI